MVILTITVSAISSKRGELMSALNNLTDATLGEKGCASCCILQDVKNENYIKLEEIWENRPLLDDHFRTDIFSALLGAVKLLGESHEVRINDGSLTEGMEAVEAIRSGSRPTQDKGRNGKRP